MAYKLIPEDDEFSTLELSIKQGESWTMGRDASSCQIVLKDPKASRKHALINNTERGIVIENLSSTNPVQLENRSITSPQLLSNGDMVKIGSCWYRFQDEKAQETPEEILEKPYKETPEEKSSEDKISDEPSEKLPEEPTDEEPSEEELSEEPSDETSEETPEEDVSKEITPEETPEEELPTGPPNETSEETTTEEAPSEEATDEEPSDETSPEGEPSDEKPSEEVTDEANDEEEPSDEEPSEETTDETTDDEEPPEEVTDEADDEVEPSDETSDEELPTAPSDSPSEEAPEEEISTLPSASEEDPLLQDFPEDIESLYFSSEDEGRWLLKVLSGPNNGAELYIKDEKIHTIGFNPAQSDIVFHDRSVSHKHATITLNAEGVITIEDLSSRNGVFVDGKRITEPTTLKSGQIIVVGSTIFMIIDNENTAETIVAPPLAAMSQPFLQQTTTTQEIIPPQPTTTTTEEDSPVKEEEIEEEIEEKEAEEEPQKKQLHEFLLHNKYIVAPIAIFLVLMIMGIASLFKSSPIIPIKIDYQQKIESVLTPFHDIKYAFNHESGKLFLLGNISTFVEHSQMLYGLHQLEFIQEIENHIVIDEGIWEEMNHILNKANIWRSISVHSPKPGAFVMTGYLKTRNELEQLNNYVNVNFPFVEKLDNQVVIEENIIDQVSNKLIENNFMEVKLGLDNGNLALTGRIGKNSEKQFNKLVEDFKNIRGIRSVKNFVLETTSSTQDIIDISEEYKVSGSMTTGNKDGKHVIINGKILKVGDTLQGMKITAIKPNIILLEKNDVKYKIEYNK